VNNQLLPILFMHIPKCAGTSVISLISQPFDDHEICPQPPYGVWSWRADEVRGYRLYRGHFSADFVEDLGAGGTKLIMMRHPLSRVVSLYDFWRSYRWDYIRSALPPINGPAIAKSGDLSNFLNTTSAFGVAQIYNPVARQLLGRRFETLMPDENAVIAASINALRGFAWIGITESFEPSIALLAALLDLPRPSAAPEANPTYDLNPDHPTNEYVDKTEPTEDERRRILDGNRIDMAIYREGCKILEKRMLL
jgi:hypothetical protein